MYVSDIVFATDSLLINSSITEVDMSSLTARALAHFERHHGIASIEQLVASGVSRSLIKRLQRDGLIEQVLQGAYRLRGQPLTELGRMVAVCTAHPGHVIAGPSAGRLLGFRRLPADLRIHTISPPHSQPTRAPWVKPYRTAAIHAGDIVRRPDGILHTSRPRTALDLSRFLTLDADLLSVIEQAMSDGHYSVDDMCSVAVDWRSPRRSWLGRYLRLLDRRVAGGAAESHPELLLGDSLTAAGVVGLSRQFPIELPGYGSARFDLAVPRLRWAIEVDVFPTHAETAGRQSDERRDRAAQLLGWSVTRLGPESFDERLGATVAWLVTEFDRRRSA
jgi:very-short-patch-repair endonuclease